MKFNIIHSQPSNTAAKLSATPTANATILFLTANPEDTQKIKLNKEFNEVQEESESAILPLKLRLRLDVSRKDLMEIFLREKPAILHFSGHGIGEKGLVLQNEAGVSEILSSSSLAALVSEFSDTLECVLLNACYSVEQAKELVKHIPFVIGVDSAIGDVKAIAFSRAFYTCLFLGEGYESAFRKAVIQVGLEAMETGAQPVLYRWDPATATTVQTTIKSTAQEEKLTNNNGVHEEVLTEEDIKFIEREQEVDLKEMLPLCWLRPKCYPQLKFLAPKEYKLTENELDYFEGEASILGFVITIFDKLYTESEALMEVFNTEHQRWASPDEEEQEDTENVNGISVTWIHSRYNDSDYELYLLAFRRADEQVCVIGIDYLMTDDTAVKLADIMFYAFKLA